jgi:hypothetical protein
MLDDSEWERVAQHWRTAKHDLSTKDPASRPSGPAWQDPLMTKAHELMLEEYYSMTGHRETNPGALWHHRVSLYGPPCGACGKPYRTPQALFCAACGKPRPVSAAV